MLTAVLLAATLLGQQADPEVLPPPPTEAEMLAEFREKFPDARIISHQILPMADGRSKICGAAEIAGRTEPLAVFPQEGDRTSVIVTLAGQRPPAGTPGLRPRQWEIKVVSPGLWNGVEGGRSDPRVQELDAFSRGLALQFCPSLRPPEGVTWRTGVDPA
ncbi:hypothetical protein [Brevundimonas sp.]|uniref:hypothetical protein n=1 Tax=Brevundimonas sp. TaxID=1871086 RepID=UPI002EDAD4FA